jgi:1,4-dihydroxy-2-naphthoate octaprenyltransferase
LQHSTFGPIDFTYREFFPLHRKIKGYFMLFRILPVMVWSFTGALVGTALAALAGHALAWTPFALVLAISAIIQGYPTHILNEIFDWKSGADSRDLRSSKSGGSKVLQARLLKMNDLWVAFAISNAIIAALAVICVRLIGTNILLYFILPGYLSGVLYSLPPFRFSYRPFLGEWLGGFSGIFFLVLGSFYAQAHTVSSVGVFAAFGLGLIYIGIMTFFHYVDFKHDQLSKPRKNTTVVYLGLSGSRRYAYVCLLSGGAILLAGSLKYQVQQLVLLCLAATVLLGHYNSDLQNDLSIIKWGKVITYSSIATGLVFASIANPALVWMAIPAALSFWAHQKFGKLNNRMGFQVINK